MKSLFIIFGLAANLLFTICEAQAQNNETLRVLNSALQTFGGEARIKSFKSVKICRADALPQRPYGRTARVFNKTFYEKFAPAPKVETFADKRIVSDGERTVEFLNVGKNSHTEENIVAYLPAEKYLFQGDLFYFGGEATFPAKDRMTVMPFFADWLKQNKLAPARIYGFHSTLFGTMEHIEKILELSSKSKK